MCMGFAAPAHADSSARDLPYGTDARQKLDVYPATVPCPAAGCPVVLFVHGGAWRMGDKRLRNTVDAGHTFAAQGVVFVGINYRLTPAVVHPAHVEDVARAIAWTNARIASYGGDPKRLFLMGHSAGAHLVALVATDGRYLAPYGLSLRDIAGVVPVDGAGYDLDERKSGDRFLNKWITDAFGPNTADASPVNHVRTGVAYPPFLIAVVKQRPSAVSQSQRLASLLRQTGDTANVLVVDYPDERTQLGAHGRIADDLGHADHVMTRQILTFVKTGRMD